jgi:hypothetical protein
LWVGSGVEGGAVGGEFAVAFGDDAVVGRGCGVGVGWASTILSRVSAMWSAVKVVASQRSSDGTTWFSRR